MKLIYIFIGCIFFANYSITIKNSDNALIMAHIECKQFAAGKLMQQKILASKKVAPLGQASLSLPDVQFCTSPNTIVELFIYKSTLDYNARRYVNIILNPLLETSYEVRPGLKVYTLPVTWPLGGGE